MKNELHASIDAATNGYVVYLRKKCEDKDDFHCQDTFIYPTIEEALEKVRVYFA